MIFKKLFDRVLIWAGHPRATAYMAGLSFAESTFFPIPPDVMLIPMMLARPKKIWHLAFLCTTASVLGGLAGYLIGALAFPAIQPLLVKFAYQEAYLQALDAFDRWGFWFILAAGFSPIPYKVFTLSAGVIGMPILPFLAGSIVGRGGRFYLEAMFIHWGGESAAANLRNWIDRLGWLLVVLLAVLIIYLKIIR